ncbi:hypothetical protein F2Q69_00020867 [Brassica cretica]|uniref:Uncharacterized protein n=1 Tax=Brassica cretica TaxID=69181 RepID=A0A8S9QFT1_BRACR|nr:hypothetical protein F2Q69_00020867 [Brassica cretica]
MMKLLHLFITSSKPVVEILLITTVGFYMALDGVNLLGQDARKFLNNIVFYVFSPSLIGSRLANSVTYESLMQIFSAESRFTPERFIGTNRATGIPAGNRVTIIKPPSSSACPSSSVFQVLESINRQFESSSNPVRHKHKRRKHHTNPHHHLAENFLVINDISSATSKHQTQNTEPSPLNGYKTRGLWLRAGGAEHREPPPPESLKSDDSTEKVSTLHIFVHLYALGFENHQESGDHSANPRVLIAQSEVYGSIRELFDLLLAGSGAQRQRGSRSLRGGDDLDQRSRGGEADDELRPKSLMPPPEKLVSRWRLGLEFDLARKRRHTKTHQPKK